MSQFIKFYFTSSMLNYIHHQEPASFLLYHHMAGWGGIRVAGLSLPHGYHPNQPCGDTIEKTQAPDDGCS